MARKKLTDDRIKAYRAELKMRERHKDEAQEEYLLAEKHLKRTTKKLGQLLNKIGKIL